MKVPNLILAILFLFFCTSCSPESTDKNPGHEAQPEESPSEQEPKHEEWGYSGESSPEHWPELEKGSACGGNLQSPINIIAVNSLEQPSGLSPSDFHHDEETVIESLVNNGHSIQYNFKAHDNYMEFKGKRFDLVQFHFHSPSEHTLNGIRYPLVMHWVHLSADNDYAVVAQFFQEGAPSETFAFLESFLPLAPGEQKEINQSYSLSRDLPKSFDHYYYKGSLTTPPCTEGVNWFVFKEPATLSEMQVKTLSGLMPEDNYRGEQDLNEREVLFSH